MNLFSDSFETGNFSRWGSSTELADLSDFEGNYAGSPTQISLVSPPDPIGVLDSKVGFVTGRTQCRKAPTSQFVADELEIWLSFWYYNEGVGATGEDFFYNGLAPRPYILALQNSDGATLGTVEVVTGSAALTIWLGGRDTRVGHPIGRISASLTATDIPIKKWTQIDCYWKLGDRTAAGVDDLGNQKYTAPGDVTIKANCATAASASGTVGITTHASPSGKMSLRMLSWLDSCTRPYYFDNVVVNNKSGSIHNNFPCLFSFPGQGGLGEATDGITIAPEKLPHVITLDDVKGNRALQKKLQDNFEAIERQLLALDPEQGDSSNPWR